MDDFAYNVAELQIKQHLPDLLVWPGTPDQNVRWQSGERLHHLFEAACDGSPKAVAVQTDERHWSYRDLDTRANELAHLLLFLGFKAGDRIALLLGRSPASYVALLAISKINAAYVPLDPAFPADRIDFICQDAKVGLILSERAHEALYKDCGGAPTLAVDDEVFQAALRNQPKTRIPSHDNQPVEELAYIIYTSGSTGRPKGVTIEQASICNFLRVAGEIYGYQAGDRVYQGLTLAFDFSVEEVLVPLMAGATLVPNTTGGALIGADLAEFLAEMRITAMCCVPTLLATIEDDLPDLRLLIVSGEACPQDLLARWVTPTRKMLNAYGPTETTVTATLCDMQPGAQVTIGHPLPTYTGLILAPDSVDPVERGQSGELCIAGVALSTGYINRPEQTEKAFVPDIFDLPNNPSGMIYRTGDLVRVAENGEIEYLGRIDTQVKIRGYRIELSEIESVLMAAPQVAQAVVSIYETPAGEKELVAYFTRSSETEASSDVAAELSELAREKLPGFMTPAYFEELDTIPMLPSDKADRKALPPPRGKRRSRANREYVAPDGPLGEDIARVMTTVLGLDTISADNHFFDELGTNSLLVARFCQKLRNEVPDLPVSIRDVYANPTINSLAAALGRNGNALAAPIEAPEPRAGNPFAFYAFGAAQIATALGYVYIISAIFYVGFTYSGAAETVSGMYGRAVLASAGQLLAAALLPIAVKWLIIGRWKETEFAVWSTAHFRYWLVKTAQRLSPAQLVRGTALYNLYLRALGANVHLEAVILSRTMPVAMDLISIGRGAIIREESLFNGHKVEAGWIKTGYVSIGDNAYLGEGSLMDINSSLGDGAQLGHASALGEFDHVPAGEVWHGSPAEPAPAGSNHQDLDNAYVHPVRRWMFPISLLSFPILVWAPLVFVFGNLTFSSGSTPSGVGVWAFLSAAPLVAVVATIGFALAFISGLMLNLVAPRLAWLGLKADHEYPLFGRHYALATIVKQFSNSRFYNYVFGDSAMIVPYLKLLGYKFTGGVVQTGSNFGVSQKHDIPYLVDIGRGTMISDSIVFDNKNVSNGRFCLSTTSIAPNNFFGNVVIVPPNHKVGPNCLIGTKTMMPIAGEVRENIGLLGSPAFEIPRSVRRDRTIVAALSPQEKATRLKAKFRHNVVTSLLFLASQLSAILLSAFIFAGVFIGLGITGVVGLTLATVGAYFMVLGQMILIERAALGFRRLKPQTCSILDPYFWYHERHWKLNANQYLIPLSGTAFAGLFLRLAGTRVGKRLYTESVGISEKTLAELGDDCFMGEKSVLQGHSLEDGAFKSGFVVLGDGCTIGATGFIHYDVEMGKECLVAPDSFVMKGARGAKGTVWRGNPADLACFQDRAVRL